MTKIYIASDHGGFELKKQLVSRLNDVEDLGPFELNENDDYPDYAEKVAKKVSEVNVGMDPLSEDWKAIGILICRSGNGVNITANKVRGAYAALCFTIKHAEMARRHDNANIICLDSDYKGDDPYDIVKAFIVSSFEKNEERHVRRFTKILEIENR